jgi:hypothetical protein
MDVHAVVVADLERERERHRRTVDRVAASLLARPSRPVRPVTAPSGSQCRRTQAAVVRRSLLGA